MGMDEREGKGRGEERERRGEKERVGKGVRPLS